MKAKRADGAGWGTGRTRRDRRYGATYVARFNNEREISTWWKSDLGSWRIEDHRLILSGTGIGKMMGVQLNTTFTSDINISVDTEWLGGIDSYGVSVSDMCEKNKNSLRPVKKDYYYISDKPVSVTEFVFCKRECP